MMKISWTSLVVLCACSTSHTELDAGPAPLDAADAYIDGLDGSREVDAHSAVDASVDAHSDFDGGAHSDAASGRDASADASPATGDLCVARGFCWDRPLPFGVNLDGVWGSSPIDIWAVGDGGTIAHYDGDNWRFVATPTTKNLNAIFGLSASDVWAVGDDGIAVHYDGTRWSESATGSTVDLNDVWAASGDRAWAVGDELTILSYRDGVWSTAETGSFYSYNCVWGSDSDNVYVGGDGSNARHWNGTLWDWFGVSSSAVSPQLMDIWGTGPNDVWAVVPNDATPLHHFDGTRWRALVTGIDWVQPVTISGTSSTDVYFLGGYHSVHWDGAAFSEIIELQNENLADAQVFGTGVAVAVGPGGRVAKRASVSGEWNIVGGFTGSGYDSLNALVSIGEDELWAGGRLGPSRRDADGWTTYSTAATEYLQEWTSIWASDADHVWIVAWGQPGDNIQRWNGASFERLAGTTYVTNNLNDVWGSGPNDVWIVGERGTLLHWNGSALESIFESYRSFETWLSIHGSSASNVWVVGGDAQVKHFAGSAWLPVDIGVADDLWLYSVFTFAPDDVWISGERGLIRHFDGELWSDRSIEGLPADSNGNVLVAAFAGHSSTDLWAAGSTGHLYHFNGTAWTSQGALGTRVSSLVMTAGGTFFVGGGVNSVLRRAAD